MDDKQTLDFWYAVNNTEVVLMPERHLETFGNTILNYHLVSELMDSVDRIRIREGRIRATRPQIITPEAYASTVLDGFGDEAQQYIDWLRRHERDVRILQYGYSLKRETFSEHVVTESMDAVLERVQQDVQQSDAPLSAVVRGVDEPWDVCLVKLFWEVIRNSAVSNLREMEQRKLFDDVGGVPRGLRNEIEDAFIAASKDPSRINQLGKLLRRYQLFDEYQDRFFSLVKSSRQ